GHLQPALAARRAGDRRRESRQARPPRKADQPHLGRRQVRARRPEEGEGPGLRLLRAALQQPVPDDAVGGATGPARRPALRRGGLLPRHRALVRAVLVEREEGRRRVEPAQRRLSCHGRAADVDGLRGGGGHELRHALEEQDLCPVRIPHDLDYHPPLQGRPGGQGGVGHRLPAALLAALPPDLHDYGYVWWMRSCNRAPSGARSAWTPSALTSATMIWPTSSWTSLNRPCVFIFCAW